MKLKFWEKSAELPAEELPVEQSEELPAEPEAEAEKRGYFDTVAAADVGVSTIGTIPESVHSPAQAMRLATVYRCTAILSGSIAALPLQLKRKKNGYFVVDEDNPIHYALTVRPNRRQTAFELMRNAIIQVVNAGNAYIYPDWHGEELRLTLLTPGSVSYDKMLDFYLVNDPVNGIYESLDSEEIIHLRGVSLDGGYTGESIIRYASRVMNIATSADRQSLAMHQPGSSYKGFISGNSDSVRGMPNFQDDQLKVPTERIEKELRSGKNIMYLQGDLRFNPLSLSAADIQLLERLKFDVLELCRFYGVHPDKVFAGQSQNYKASEMSQVQYMTDTLQPILRQVENEFFVKLIPRGLASKYRIEYDLEAFYQTDLDSLSKYMEKEIQWGVSTPNEWRRKRGREPKAGGDKNFISCNVAPIDSARITGEKNISQKAEKMPPKNSNKPVG